MNDDQADEQEVLLSIYEDDTNFKQISDTVYCYKFISEENELKSLMIQVPPSSPPPPRYRYPLLSPPPFPSAVTS